MKHRWRDINNKTFSYGATAGVWGAAVTGCVTCGAAVAGWTYTDASQNYILNHQ